MMPSSSSEIGVFNGEGHGALRGEVGGLRMQICGVSVSCFLNDVCFLNENNDLVFYIGAGSMKIVWKYRP